jgi:hypothetical protein
MPVSALNKYNVVFVQRVAMDRSVMYLLFAINTRVTLPGTLRTVVLLLPSVFAAVVGNLSPFLTAIPCIAITKFVRRMNE